MESMLTFIKFLDSSTQASHKSLPLKAGSLGVRALWRPNTVPVPTALEVEDMNHFLSIALILLVTPAVAADAAAISVVTVTCISGVAAWAAWLSVSRLASRESLSLEIALSGAAQCQIPVLSIKLLALFPL